MATSAAPASSVLWFRRDLRLHDHPALLAAAREAGTGGVVPLFVVDPALYGPAGPPRRAYLLRSLHALDAATGGRMRVVQGDPVEVVPRLAERVGAGAVHVSADYGPYGRRRDAAVAEALEAAGRHLAATGSPYAVAPGTLAKSDGEPYKVFTPFSRAWEKHGWSAPAGSAGGVHWAADEPDPGGERQWPDEPDLGAMRLPEAGEEAARERWETFLDEAIAAYADGRDRPDRPATSQLSVSLKYGELHPRTLLAGAAKLPSDGAATFRTELCWRDFYADVLWHRPETAREHYRGEFARMRHDEPGEAFRAWTEGRTGFPFVDAGMRQLRAEGWVHNRARMVVASFLVKDLHVEWQHGARYFMHWLRDGDLASNNHGWQWVAGTGTDAAPFFRIFNPVTQGQKFDPDGEYVRRYVQELRHLPGKAAHTPWDHPEGYDHGYPRRVVDHAAERTEALTRLSEITA